MTALTLPVVDCWNTIGVRGDRSCPELTKVGHCHNCPVFAAAGRRFLDAPPPPGYRDEWATRLAEPPHDEPAGRISVLVFRLGEEWLALPVGVLVEVTAPRPAHRVPHKGGLLAGVVNVRGELQLLVRLDALLGIVRVGEPERLLVVRREGERWVFPADEVDQVWRVPAADVADAPATLARASAHLTRGVFAQDGRSVGVMDDARVWAALRARVR